MTEVEYQAFLSAWENYPSQDNEGYQPDRGSFKSGFFAGVEYMKAENARLREALEIYANPDYWQAIQGDDQEYLYVESIGQKSYVQGKIARAALEGKE